MIVNKMPLMKLFPLLLSSLKQLVDRTKQCKLFSTKWKNIDFFAMYLPYQHPENCNSLNSTHKTYHLETSIGYVFYFLCLRRIEETLLFALAHYITPVYNRMSIENKQSKKKCFTFFFLLSEGCISSNKVVC